MKFSNVVLLLIVIITATGDNGVDHIINKKLDAFKDCVEERNVTDGVARIFYKVRMPANIREQCFLSCAYTKFGWIQTNGTINLDQVETDINIMNNRYLTHNNPLLKFTTQEMIIMRCCILRNMNLESSKEECLSGRLIRLCVDENLHFPMPDFMDDE